MRRGEGGVGSDFILKVGGLEVILHLVQWGVTSLKGLRCSFARIFFFRSLLVQEFFFQTNIAFFEQ